jgi:hypothetical protein
MNENFQTKMYLKSADNRRLMRLNLCNSSVPYMKISHFLALPRSTIHVHRRYLIQTTWIPFYQLISIFYITRRLVNVTCLPTIEIIRYNMHCCTYKSRQKAKISLKTEVKSSFSRMILKSKQFRGNNLDEGSRVMSLQPYAATHFVFQFGIIKKNILGS